MFSFHQFVYGTLKVGQPNHMLLTDPGEYKAIAFVLSKGLVSCLDNGRAEFVVKARTLDKFPLVIASKVGKSGASHVPGISR